MVTITSTTVTREQVWTAFRPYGQKTHLVKASGIVGTLLMLCPYYASNNGG
jgi:hypothetical protein